MQTYLYRCRTCTSECLLFEPADDAGPCLECVLAWNDQHEIPMADIPLMKRVWAVQFAPVMQEHFNLAVGRPISDRRQMDRELHRASEEATERTGIPHRFAQVDGSEAKQAAGIDDALQDEINRIHAHGGSLPRTTRTPTAMPEYASVADRRAHIEDAIAQGKASSGLANRGKAVAEPIRPT